ncbi:uncharacterized protein L201_006491 [Kwoniella dendrophila CBS 6074]|uniref:Uncharacterized protein n=1 Tax=Kwoniella dendrophila CBS 6074 TaxID=1295534 RepID=A0AAX4K424_9TREE
MSFLPNMAGINYVPGPNAQAGIPSGTAQTSGFVQAGDAPRSEQVGTTSSSTLGGSDSGSRFGGGLGSSPLVPKPGHTINPETGKPHSEGLTREELQAKRAAEAAAVTAQLSSSTSAELNDQVDVSNLLGGLGTSPLVPKTGTSINPETGNLHSEGLTREELQAKRAAEAAASEAKHSSATSVQPSGEISQDELKQIQEKGKELLDPTPHHQQARRSSSPKAPFSALPSVSEDNTVKPHATALTKDGRRLSDLSGREQAARQLVGNTLQPPSNSRQDSGLITPGLELPGGWGPVGTVPLPGTAANAPTSIYEDVAEGLEKAGRAAYSVIPQPIKEAFSTSPTSPKLGSSSTLGVSPPSGRRSSVTALFDQAKSQTSKLLGDAQGTLQNTQRRASASLSKDSEFRNKISDFVDNFAHAGPGFIAAGTGRPGAVGIVPRYSLPSDEVAGALPGEHTSGVGALPGSSNETGVAVLPDEKKAPAPVPSHQNQGVLPGENSGAFGDYSIGLGSRQGFNPSSSVAGPSGTSNISEPSASIDKISPSASTSAVVPEPSDAIAPSPNAATTSPSTSSAPVESTTTSSTKPISEISRSTHSGSSYAGLAAPLPATFLGLGGDRGATDVPAALGTSSDNANSLVTAPEPTSTVESGSAPATSTLSPASASEPRSVESVTGSGSSPLAVPETRHANERTTSAASVTAIRHGHEGSFSKSSPLAGDSFTVPEHEELDTSAIGQKSTTPGTGPNHTTSLTPGNEHEGIGHPASRDIEGTSRQPQTYPTADHSGSVAAATAATTAATSGKLHEEKQKAEALVDAPASSSDVAKTTPAAATTEKELPTTTSSKVQAEPPANGPTQTPVSTVTEHATTSTSGPSADTVNNEASIPATSNLATKSERLPEPTSATEARNIAEAKKTTPTSTSTPTPTATSSSPATTATHSPASPSSKVIANETSGNGHARKASTSSEKKRGLFGKIKDKLKH